MVRRKLIIVHQYIIKLAKGNHRNRIQI